jgi:ankyrin repeat protein
MNGIDQELIKAATESNLLEVCRRFTVGADVNAKDSIFDTTPLHEVSLKGHLQVFQALREHVGDIDAKDIYHDTPLHNAALMGHTFASTIAMAQLLVSSTNTRVEEY